MTTWARAHTKYWHAVGSTRGHPERPTIWALCDKAKLALRPDTEAADAPAQAKCERCVRLLAQG